MAFVVGGLLEGLVGVFDQAAVDIARDRDGAFVLAHGGELGFDRMRGHLRRRAC